MARHKAAADVPPEALELVRQFEGFRGAPYRCPAGKPTIGYGLTTYPGGAPVTMQDPPIDEATAQKLLKDALRLLLPELAAVEKERGQPLSTGQRAALLSFIFNIGLGAFRRSTLRSHLVARDDLAAVKQFDRWVHVTGAGGKKRPLRGLILRRAAEVAAFTSKDDTNV